MLHLAILPNPTVDNSIDGPEINYQQSFLMELLKSELTTEVSTSPLRLWFLTYVCCCIVGLWHKVWASLPIVVVRESAVALYRWLYQCLCGCSDDPSDIEHPRTNDTDNSKPPNFICIDFNAWEFASSEVIWASLVANIFDAVGCNLYKASLPLA